MSDEIKPGLGATSPEALTAFLARDHEPRWTEGGDGSRHALDDEALDEEGNRRVGVACLHCGYHYDAERYTPSAIPVCDGVVGLARRLRRRAEAAKRRWLHLDEIAAGTERAALNEITPILRESFGELLVSFSLDAADLESFIGIRLRKQRTHRGERLA